MCVRARDDDVSETDSTMDEIQYINHRSIRPIDLLSYFLFFYFIQQ